MYVDKPLSGIKAVQTLSRLNRAHPKKSDTFVLDFMNSTDVIRESFADYYQTTVLSDETDPNKLHDLKAGLDQAQVYSQDEIDGLVEKYLNGEDRSTFEPVLGLVRRTIPKVGRGRAGPVQRLGEVIHQALRVPVPNTPIRQPELGKALDIPEFPDSQAARLRRSQTSPWESWKPWIWKPTGPRSRQPSR